MLEKYWALKVAYIGKGYRGFQEQPGLNTIAKMIKQAMVKTGINDDFTFASRTDSGVNAFGQVISIKTSKNVRLGPLNKCLPGDIAIWGIAEVQSSFNPRKNNFKTYKYFIPHKELDIDLMRRAAELLVGTHDFSNFYKTDKKRPHLNPVRTLDSLSITKTNGFFVIEFIAKSFLWQMCRRIASYIIDIGNGSSSFEETVKFIDKSKTGWARVQKPVPAPAEYLTLQEIEYRDVTFIERIEYLDKLKNHVRNQGKQLEVALDYNNYFERELNSIK
ncbi:MAG: tRNA pseudouridine(38-40) synthase TruA [Candidatus Hodarchaeales archaeon]